MKDKLKDLFAVLGYSVIYAGAAGALTYKFGLIAGIIFLAFYQEMNYRLVKYRDEAQ